MIRRFLKFLAEHMAASALSAAGQQIGESIGRRIGDRIHPPRPEDEETEE
jgi:hypothetical protein